MAPVSRSIVCLDFDGVCNTYASGWMGVVKIVDGPTPGLREWLGEATRNFRVAVFSSRSQQPGGSLAMLEWWEKHRLPDVEFWTTKPPARLHIDDRALTFTGNWDDFPMERLLEFQPWNRK